MYFKPVLVLTSFLYIVLCHHDFIAFVDGGNLPVAAEYQMGDAAVNCGSIGNSTALDGREWIGDAPSKFLSGKSIISTAAQKSFLIDPVPYKTSRISATKFRYTFEVNPGQKIIRLHFYPASYRGFENSVDFFTVKAGPFTLLRDFSASFTADTSGMKYIVKEFCLNVEVNRKLNITFSPSLITKSKGKIHAFVNGIEIISMPAGLYYTLHGELGARFVGLHNGHKGFYVIDNSTALEVIQRLNIGGSSILPIEDFGMFRRWSQDTNYLLESGVHRVNHPALRIKYTDMPAFVAPPKLYQTSWKTGGNTRVNQMYNFTWKIPIELGFGYLVRLHFCELDDGLAQNGQREFSILINNHIAEVKANVIGWSGGTGIPVYRDYLVMVKGEKEGCDCDLLVSLQSVDVLIFELLKGLEIFKLSNLQNSLATPNPTIPKRVLTSWNLNIQNFFLVFGPSNAVVTGITALMIIVNVLVYYLRQIWEEKLNLENDTRAATTEPSHHRFSLADIMSATQNFSDAFVIGRGGFGKVYKGFIRGMSEIVAIKRLSSMSSQGPREFWTEIETLSKLRHIHLVSLIGYCNESEEMILVYEYMPRGTLADNLYKMSRKGKDIAPLTWEQRLRICIGAARGLEYLHTGTEYGIIHRDVKDSNILLDEDFVAKVSDFGLSKLEKITQSRSYISTKVKGTVGYLDPDYLTTHRLTRKSDVYAFGVVLLVVLSGRPAVDRRTPEEPLSLLSCFRECIAVGDIDRIVDPSLQGKILSDSLTEFVKSVENCLHHLPKKRPTMAQVVASLEQALAQQEIPMVPAFGDTTAVGQPFEEATVESLPIFEEGVLFPRTQVITGNTAQVSASPTRGNASAVIRKSVRSSLWDLMWNKAKPMKRTGNKQKDETLPLYSYETLATATDYFHSRNKIGEGYPGPVYKGILLNGQEIAVTRVSLSSTQWITEVMNEVMVTSNLQHRNIVRLLGHCDERKEKLLIYEFMPNSSLDAYFFDSKERRDMLDWKRRAIIIKGIGRGLLFLHRYSGLEIIHKALSASNILLDKDLNPKISNIGMARILQGSQDEALTAEIAGTYPYMAPEYHLHGVFSVKSDVYSYGVLLLEILSGKRNRSFGDYEYHQMSIEEYAWKLWSEDAATKFVDRALFCPPFETDQILRYVHVGLLCVQYSPEDRPNISTVLSMLDGDIAELPLPKSPPQQHGQSSFNRWRTIDFSLTKIDLSLTTFEGR